MSIDSVIDFKDFTDQSIVRDSRISSNQIKFKQLSFQSILKRWEGFRVSILQKALEAEKNRLVESSYVAKPDGDLAAVSHEVINKRAEWIAKLEEKIKIIAKEEVPENFVKNRAIKLRQNMMDYLVRKSAGIYDTYTVSKEDATKVFEEPAPEKVEVVPETIDATADLVNSVFVPEPVVAEPTSIDVQKVSDENEEAIKNDINDAMNEAEVVNEIVEEEQPKETEEPVAEPVVEEVVMEAPAEPVVEPIVVEPIVDAAIEPVVEEAIVEAPVVPVVEKVKEKEQPLRDDFVQVIDDTRDNMEVPKKMEEVEAVSEETPVESVVAEVAVPEKSITEMREQLEEMKAKLLKTVASVDDARKMQSDTEAAEKEAAEKKAVAKEKLDDVMRRFSVTCDGYAQEIKENEDLRESILSNVNERKEKIANQMAETDSYVEQRREIEELLSGENIKRR